MSLNFDLKKIEDYETVCYDGDGNIKPVTNSLLWATMTLDMGQITEANAGEFYARLILWTKLVGAFYMKQDGTAIEVTAEDVVAHIGLTTNVITRTRPQWYARQINPILNEYRQEAEKLLGVGDPA
jgi:hypothetical protein